MSVARFAGWNLLTTLPRVALAEPRSTLGFMLSPASQAGPHRARKESCQERKQEVVGLLRRRGAESFLRLEGRSILKAIEVSWSLACYYRFSHRCQTTYQECLLVSQKILPETLSGL